MSEKVENYAGVLISALKDTVTLIRKGKSYGSSWRNRGGTGAFMMLARKWDRIENQAKGYNYDIFKAIQEDNRDEGLIDDIRDLRQYLLLVESHTCREGNFMTSADKLEIIDEIPIASHIISKPEEGEASPAYVNQD